MMSGEAVGSGKEVLGVDHPRTSGTTSGFGLGGGYRSGLGARQRMGIRARGEGGVGRLAPAILVLGLLVSLSPPAEGQTLRGHLRETGEEGQRLSEAYVALLTADSALVDIAVTDRFGEFELTGAGEGQYWVLSRRLGYGELLDGPLYLFPGDTFTVQVRMKPEAIALDGVTARAEGRSRYLTAQGFYRRKSMGNGIFIEREEIERRQPDGISNLFEGRESVEILYEFEGNRIRFRGNRCDPLVYLDGFALEYERFDWIVHPSDVEAMEAYGSPSEVPVEYQGRRKAGCGVVLIWTRRGID